MKSGFPFSWLVFAFLLLSAQACKDGDNGPDQPNFDRQELLRDYADNLIVPAYDILDESTLALEQAVAVFLESPTVGNLAAAQQAWAKAYADWQFVNSYNFGPAGESGVRKGLHEEIATWPADAAAIEARIQAGNTNFNDFERDTRGLVAIEYLLFSGAGSNQALADLFEASENRRAYLAALVDHTQTRVAEVNTAWNGDYLEEFVSNDGTDVGSSTSQLYNEFVRSFEAIKNFKLGLPLGKRPGQTQTEPELVEAYYSGLSLIMLKADFVTVVDFWYGRNRQGTDGAGFRDYLLSVEGGQALVDATEEQIDRVQQALDAVPATPDLSEQIAADPQAVDDLYTELQKLTRYFKSDMSSLLGIAITYASGDGD